MRDTLFDEVEAFVVFLDHKRSECTKVGVGQAGRVTVAPVKERFRGWNFRRRRHQGHTSVVTSRFIESIHTRIGHSIVFKVVV